MRWDPAQYELFADHRSRPFFDLVGRIGHHAPRRVVDLGCGSGELTAVLAQRWPDAEVLGIDSSPEMVNAARRRPHQPPNLAFAVGDVRDFRPAAGTDVVVSNAVLQWVQGHQELLVQWASLLEEGAWLAVQVPGNFSAPSHTLMRGLADSERWRGRLGGVLRHDDAVGSPDEYLRLLRGAGLETDAWETTYLHLLHGADPVLEWVRGTGLRPVLAALPEQDAAEFEQAYARDLRLAYPAEADGATHFPFRRIFAVGVKSPTP
ncbi:trans-aconitate 2-methyltransferase [Arthrobacter sp. JZ12]|uniref:trans-aconitate 2-methyltransferase n=1 Tax=Arthrobacter sp. JZ12 TaxID=2654190 RepID=UPI002B466EDE|nr:trans-aconitate 2-methyltransferase [Arthrobacter sp. JZ12]WRH26449.1 trans-aconitate 2-methyltransferase [Arthrobacter sp. JZ12]